MFMKLCQSSYIYRHHDLVTNVQRTDERNVEHPRHQEVTIVQRTHERNVQFQIYELHVK